MSPELTYRAALRASFGQDPQQVTGHDATGEHQLSEVEFTHGTRATPTGTKGPPRPQNAWILYRTAKLKQFQAQSRARSNAEMHSAGSSSTDLKERRRLCIQAEASRLIATMWKEEDAAVKASYFALANDNKVIHSIAFPDYKFKPKRKARLDKRDSATSFGPGSYPSRSGTDINTTKSPMSSQKALPTIPSKIVGRTEHAQQQQSGTYQGEHLVRSKHPKIKKAMSYGACEKGRKGKEESSCNTYQDDKNALHKTLIDSSRMVAEPISPKSKANLESGPDTSFIPQPGPIPEPFLFDLNTDGIDPDDAAALLDISSRMINTQRYFVDNTLSGSYESNSYPSSQAYRSSASSSTLSFSTQPSVTPCSSEQQLDCAGQDGRMQASYGGFDWFSSISLNQNLPLVSWDTAVGSHLSSHLQHQGREVCGVQQPRDEIYTFNEGGSHIVATPVNIFLSNALQLQFPSQHIHLHPQSTGHTGYGVWTQPKGRCDDEYQFSSWNGL